MPEFFSEQEVTTIVDYKNNRFFGVVVIVMMLKLMAFHLSLSLSHPLFVD